jgi:predicted transposase YdaD
LNRAFAVWIIRVLQNRKMLKEPIPEINDIVEVDAMFAESIDTWTEKWKMEGLQEGLQEGWRKGEAKGRMEGEAKGRMEGEVEGRSAVLLRLLAKRFGPESVGSKTQERLRTADHEQFDLWTERILDAQTIDEVFDERKNS